MSTFDNLQACSKQSEAIASLCNCDGLARFAASSKQSKASASLCNSDGLARKFQTEQRGGFAVQACRQQSCRPALLASKSEGFASLCNSDGIPRFALITRAVKLVSPRPSSVLIFNTHGIIFSTTSCF